MGAWETLRVLQACDETLFGKIHNLCLGPYCERNQDPNNYQNPNYPGMYGWELNVMHIRGWPGSRTDIRPKDCEVLHPSKSPAIFFVILSKALDVVKSNTHDDVSNICLYIVFITEDTVTEDIIHYMLHLNHDYTIWYITICYSILYFIIYYITSHPI